MRPLDRRRQHGYRSRRAALSTKTLASSRSIRQRCSALRSRPISTRSRARCDSSACLPGRRARSACPRDTSSGHASPSARPARTAPDASQAEQSSSAARTTLRQASTTTLRRRAAASTSSSRRSRFSPRADHPGGRRVEDARRPVDLGRQRGDPSSRAQRVGPTSAALAASVRRRRIAIPATTSSMSGSAKPAAGRHRLRQHRVRPRRGARPTTAARLR